MADIQEYGRNAAPPSEQIGTNGYCAMCGIHPDKSPGRQLFEGACECGICMHCFGTYCLTVASKECPVCRAENSFHLEIESDAMCMVLGTVFSRLEEAEEKLENIQHILLQGMKAKRTLAKNVTVMQCPLAPRCKFKMPVDPKYADCFDTLPGTGPNKDLKVIIGSCCKIVKGFRDTNQFKKARKHIRDCVSQKLNRPCEEEDLPPFFRTLVSFPDYKAMRYGSKTVTPPTNRDILDSSDSESVEDNDEDSTGSCSGHSPSRTTPDAPPASQPGSGSLTKIRSHRVSAEESAKLQVNEHETEYNTIRSVHLQEAGDARYVEHSRPTRNDDSEPEEDSCSHKESMHSESGEDNIEERNNELECVKNPKTNVAQDDVDYKEHDDGGMQECARQLFHDTEETMNEDSPDVEHNDTPVQSGR